LLGDGARRHAYHGLARRGAAAAARVAHAVLLVVRVVRVPRAEFLRDRRVVLRPLVLVAHEKADRGAGGAALEHAREDLHRVGLATLGDVARGTGLSSIQLFLDILVSKGKTRWTAVHHPAIGGAV